MRFVEEFLIGVQIVFEKSTPQSLAHFAFAPRGCVLPFRKSHLLHYAVLPEWRQARHEAFQPRNVWSLFNAFTESLKEGNLAELPKRTEALHGLLDIHVGLSA